MDKISFVDHFCLSPFSALRYVNRMRQAPTTAFSGLKRSARQQAFLALQRQDTPVHGINSCKLNQATMVIND
jgi:hypothetical protein